jgi:ribosomal protein S18 acetylase RimI-like enzyme
MSGSSDRELLRRLVEFELALMRESSELVEDFDWGRLILNPSTSALWSDNYLELDSSSYDAAQLAAMADELLGAHGMEHRLVEPVDPAVGARLELGFRDLGWRADRSLYMVHTRDPERPGSPAAEVPRAEVDGVERAVAEDDPDFTAEAVDQQSIRDARIDPIAHGRRFAAPAGEVPGATCVLYELDGVGQVEHVGTVPDRRGEGLASAVVLAAVDASRQAGHELTFIIAQADDWPWRLYERLGFDRVGESHSFLRKPDQVSDG